MGKGALIRKGKEVNTAKMFGKEKRNMGSVGRRVWKGKAM